MKLVFASCMDAEREPVQPVWDHIRTFEQPDALALLGDQIYMDWGDLGEPNLAHRMRNGLLSLDKFANRMHDRYAAQWRVDSFRRLVCSIPQRHQPGRLIVCWDDHDFAWNNSLGAGPDNRNLVPHTVRSVARRLFAQFVHHLRTGADHTSYPERPADVLVPWPEGGVGEHGHLPNSSLPYRLLDNRWNRSARLTEQQGHMLEESERNELMADVARSEGLLVVLGGTPLAHDHLFSEQSWHSVTEGDYSEYRDLLTKARRPVLYLGGDVHHNVWSGRLLHPDTAQPSQVLQVLSSGAALGKLPFGIQPDPSYGVLEVADTPLHCEARIHLWEQQDGEWVPTVRTPAMPYQADGWLADLQGAAAVLDDGPPDTQPLAALVCRPRARGYRREPAVSVTHLPELNKMYERDGWPAQDLLPEPLEVTSHDGLSVQASTQGSLRNANRRAAEIDAHIGAAFARARARGAASVVLYLHGVEKPLGAALSQAYALRRQDPAAEPIAFCWQAGERQGLLDAGGVVAMARTGADAADWALAECLEALAQHARHADNGQLTTVVLARSAGALLLHHALYSTAYEPDVRFQGIARLVLSAPMLDQDKLLRHSGLNQSMGRWHLPKYVVSNRNDRTLRWGRWLYGVGKADLAGLAPPDETPPPGVHWLDHTDCPGTGSLHDHLFVQLGEHARAVRHSLLCARQVDLASLVDQQHLQTVRPGVWRVC